MPRLQLSAGRPEPPLALVVILEPLPVRAPEPLVAVQAPREQPVVLELGLPEPVVVPGLVSVAAAAVLEPEHGLVLAVLVAV